MGRLRRLFSRGFNFMKRISILSAIKRASDPSYYPEKPRKCYIQRVWDNIKWLFQYKEVNRFYTLYGLDIKGSDGDSYKDYLGFMRERDRFNKPRDPDSQVAVLRDKFLFYIFMKNAGCNVPEVFGVMRNKVLYNQNMDIVDEEALLKNETEYFIKDASGECASFVKKISNYEEYMAVKSQMSAKGTYIFQRKITQSEEMNRFNPCAVNTLRIVTVNVDGNPYVLSSVLRLGTAEAKNVDNWAAGGLSVGIKEDGSLQPFGYYKSPSRGKTDKHPDTGIVFAESRVEEYSECVKAAIQAHKWFYGVRFIGWDVAITPDGPTFVEGNDNWEISLMQGSNKPLRDDWKQSCRS